MAWSLLSYSLGEYWSKRWANEPCLFHTLMTVGSYAIAQIGWLPALRLHGSLSALTVAWSLAATVCGVLIGTLVFGETLVTRQIFGMILAVIATLMVL